MAHTNGRPTPKLIDRLFQEGHRFSFIQAFRFLLLHMRREGLTEPSLHELSKRIRIRPELSLAFPETDITEIASSSTPGTYRITAAFLGLYGSSSPLPTFYTEDLLQEMGQDRSVSRDFYDIFNSRIYTLYFNIWRYYRLFFDIFEEPNECALERLYCLAGLGGAELRKTLEHPFRLLRYAGLATQFPRSAEGLRSILADGLNEPSLHITQCVERLAVIPADQRLFLGRSGNILGENAYLGQVIADRAGNFRIHIGPVDKESFERYLPDQPTFAQIDRLVGYYLDQPLVWDVEITVKTEGLSTIALGDRCLLGCNTWIFSPEIVPGECRVLFPQTGLQ